MIKKLIALISLLMIVGAFSACTSNPAKVEANNAEFAEQVEAEAEGNGNLAQSFTTAS